MCGQNLREEVGGSNFVGFSARPGRLETARFPGCLTSESEERETWTAESLRTAPRVRRFELNGFGFFLKRGGMEENSAGGGFCFSFFFFLGGKSWDWGKMG